MGEQLSYLPPARPSYPISARTYIYFREEDGKLVHCNASSGFIGKEYEHDDPDWQPGADWPYEVVDWRKKERR